ncbi:C6 finger domain protein [Cordyceps fumosorosea ARSEF 2679]|uniref:C6 finger domain protein n=1 Tax=Cordyceps fumosorosea (strain ARSEF 2679) TaxID=1081104 RepID=A0A162MBA9_CORFA|nr:C6 finger domain protein [Cordyceps fumosorosea ARSEF 2679]OAA53710.1 C6 finger domain protein [Cordyceps fumosorosea ARSEF 2679]
MTEAVRTTRRRKAASESAVKPRRSHRKSRNGCAECRRRHIRCDKNHPVCFNCSTGDRDCAYPAGTVWEESPRAGAEAGVRAEPDHRAAPTPSRFGSLRHTPVCPPPDADADADAFSVTDLLVFHHAQTAMEHVGLGRKGQFHKVLALGLRHRALAPYLLDQILALACVHLALTLPGAASSVYAGLTADTLRHHATALQTRAVACFNARINDPADPDVDSARFLFAGVLSLQFLAETLGALRVDGVSFGDFVDRMVACFQLHGGMRVATGRPIREFLPQSRDLHAIMDFLHVADDKEWRTAPRGRECAALITLLEEEADLGAASLAACRGAAHGLQWSFDMCRGLAVEDGPHAASAFAVTAPPAYVEALRRRAPEALVVLAHFGVLLHRCRACWIFGDAGARMVRAVADHVGMYWREAMRWPLEEIGAER